MNLSMLIAIALRIATPIQEAECAPPAEVAWALAAEHGDQDPDAAYEDAIAECLHNLYE